MKPIKVMIVEDSPTQQILLREIIEHDPRLAVCYLACDGEQAMQGLIDTQPDVISMDICLPKIDGLTVTRQVMTEQPTPIVVLQSVAPYQGAEAAIEALAAGALTLIEKPANADKQGFELIANLLCDQLYLMSQVKVITQRQGRQKIPQTQLESPPKIIAIASSTGGPQTLVDIFSLLQSDYRLPILLVQHMTAEFMVHFADWLASILPIPVVLPQDGDRIYRGGIYIAPAHKHLIVESGKIRLTDGPQEQFQKPSANILFRSIAQQYRAASIGIVLTGMGNDGAEGLLAMAEKGAQTIAQSPQTAIIDSMPTAAINNGAAKSVLAPLEIAQQLKWWNAEAMA